jgi:hypothetical protein
VGLGSKGWVPGVKSPDVMIEKSSGERSAWPREQPATVLWALMVRVVPSNCRAASNRRARASRGEIFPENSFSLCGEGRSCS